MARSRPIGPFKTAAFDHSATPPNSDVLAAIERGREGLTARERPARNGNRASARAESVAEGDRGRTHTESTGRAVDGSAVSVHFGRVGTAASMAAAAAN